MYTITETIKLYPVEISGTHYQVVRTTMSDANGFSRTDLIEVEYLLTDSFIDLQVKIDVAAAALLATYN